MKHLLLFPTLCCLILVSCSKETAQPVEPVVPVTTIGDSLSIVRVDDEIADVSWTTTVTGATSIMIAWERVGSPASRDSLQLQLDAKATRLSDLEPSEDYR